MVTIADNKLQNRNLLKKSETFPAPRYKSTSPSFKGAMDIVTAGLQMCEQVPMVNVSVIDVATCIGPRTIVDTKTNAHAGLETLRRESSGLVFNCLLPSFFVMGVAAALRPMLVPSEFKHLSFVRSWANEETIEELSKHFQNKGTKEESVKSFVHSVFSNLEGFNGEGEAGWKAYSTSKGFKEACDKASSAILSSSKSSSKTEGEILKLLSQDILATETVRFKGEKNAFCNKLSYLVRDVVDLGKKFSDDAVINNIGAFKKTAVKLVNYKSFAGLAVIMPLCMSLQAINRYITRKKSGVAGAPIYKDFAQANASGTKSFGAEKKKVVSSKDNLFLHKILGAAVIGAVAIASLTKPAGSTYKKMLQFKGWFPDMNQARWIAAGTFISRIFAAEDNNEVRESTVRDAVGFAGFYLLGDYGGKAMASLIHKFKPDVKLFNIEEPLKDGAGVFAKIKHWVKGCNLKTFDEMPKELKNYRSICQLSSLGVSLAVLGLLIPIWNRRTTEKNRAKELAALKEAKDSVQADRAKLKQNTILHIWESIKTPESETFGKFEQLTFRGLPQS